MKCIKTIHKKLSVIGKTINSTSLIPSCQDITYDNNDNNNNDNDNNNNDNNDNDNNNKKKDDNDNDNNNNDDDDDNDDNNNNNNNNNNNDNNDNCKSVTIQQYMLSVWQPIWFLVYLQLNQLNKIN